MTARLRVFVGDHPQFAPLAAGDIDGAAAFEVVRDGAPKRHDYIGVDLSMDVAELSLARHLMRIARGDRSWVAIPVFPLREFPHRFFFVRAGGSVRSMSDLAGGSVGITDWAATGSAWGRVAIDAAGVRVEDVRWRVGPAQDGGAGPSGAVDHAPAISVERTQAGRSLVASLADGGLDAVVAGLPPVAAERAGLTRLFANVRDAERDFYAARHIYPGIHVLCVRRDLFDSDVSLSPRLFSAFERSRDVWQKKLATYHGGTPWTIVDVEETRALMGDDWQPGGVAPNASMVETLCARLFADGLLARPITMSDVFADFVLATEGTRAAAV